VSWDRARWLNGHEFPAVKAGLFLVGMLAMTSGVAAIQVPEVLSKEATRTPAETEVTFSRDVAPILQAKCQECHQAGSIGPMSLVTYEEVRPWAPLIRDRVENRMMPPWHIDPTVGIQEFRNDASLTDEEIALIRDWVEGGGAEGDPADLPAAEQWPDGSEFRLSEQLGAPDLVVRSDPYTVRPNGQDQWWDPVTPTGLLEDRWIRAIEVKPSYPLGRKVTHHVVLQLRSEEGAGMGLLTEWAMGKLGEVMPERTGRLLPAGSHIAWDIHYYPIGEVVEDDGVGLAFWFHPEGYEPEFTNSLRLFRADAQTGPQGTLARGAEIDISPHSRRMIQGHHVMATPVRVESFQAHMHLRGVKMSMEAIYPDGNREVLSVTDRFQHNWQISYEYAEHAMPLLPAGTVLVFTSWFDNTDNNPNNPDPDQWVGFGRRTADEMAHAWVGITLLDEESFARLLSERNTAP